MSSEESGVSQTVAVLEMGQHLEARTIDALFLNRKPLEVRYYFEDRGTEEPLIIIDVDSLRPIFKDVHRTTTKCFKPLDEISAFVRDNIQFNKCSNYQYAECVCHLLESRTDPEFPDLEMFPPSDCSLGHFHHACSSCVNLWLNEYLRVLILLRESKPLFAKAAREICSRVNLFDDFGEFYNRESPEFYLRVAQRWTVSDYLLDRVIDTVPF
ncbi:Rep2 [Hyposoter didymator ichnovirus]|nr:Rep2 [Hyposoter didymator ichnovirus]